MVERKKPEEFPLAKRNQFYLLLLKVEMNQQQMKPKRSLILNILNLLY